MSTNSGGDRVHTFRLIGTDGFAVGLKNDSNLVFPGKKKLVWQDNRKGLHWCPISWSLTGLVMTCSLPL